MGTAQKYALNSPKKSNTKRLRRLDRTRKGAGRDQTIPTKTQQAAHFQGSLSWPCV
jgi:hypothetical protein